MKKIFLHIMMLTFPIWGSLLLLGFFVLMQKNFSSMGDAESNGDLILVPFLLLSFFLSGYPIIKWNKPIPIKLLVAILYYLVAALVSFYILYIGAVAVFGWRN